MSGICPGCGHQIEKGDEDIIYTPISDRFWHGRCRDDFVAAFALPVDGASQEEG